MLSTDQVNIILKPKGGEFSNADIAPKLGAMDDLIRSE